MQCIDSDGDTALHLAAKYSRREMLLTILEHKPYEFLILSGMRNKSDQTAFDIAQALAKNKKDPGVERSVLYLIENAFNLSLSTTRLHNSITFERLRRANLG